MATPSPDPSNDTRAAELGAWLRLALTPGLAHADRLRLLQSLGPPEDWLDGGSAATVRLLGQAAASRLHGPDEHTVAAVDAALAWCEQPGCHLVTLADAAYPPGLLDLADPPLLLFVRAHSLTVLAQPGLAIVGSRHATDAGRGIALGFARVLAEHGFSIISGLAQGIDAAAHEGALTAPFGRTIAVMGTGIDRVYPAGHRALAHRIVALGALVSELPLGAPPVRHHFPRRNRLIAALARGVLVVEAARQSGSLITARLAAETGREVFAVPGSIHSPVSRGSHLLIRQGAKLVESAEDVLEELPAAVRASVAQLRQDEPNAPARGGQSNPAGSGGVGMATDPLLEIIGWAPVSMDSLMEKSALSHAELAERLLEHELAARIERLPDGRLVRTRPGTDR
ncbi:MAG: DNA-processing protein DprA [Burkholderiaceae bacterium]